MTSPNIKLPIPVLVYPHWRVNFRPQEYVDEAVPSLGECLRIIEKNRVRLRGWDYPHLGSRENEREYGKNWAGSWSQFMGHYEYWRFYQSRQFLHLFSVRESTEEGLREKLQAETASHLSYIRGINWNKVPGFISIINSIYRITEIIEFAARLCQAEIYKGQVEIIIQLNKIKGFVLTTGWERAWFQYCAASEDVLGRTWAIESEALIRDSAQHCLGIVVWFFERFGWLDPSIETIRKDIDDFLKGRM